LENRRGKTEIRHAPSPVLYFTSGGIQEKQTIKEDKKCSLNGQ
jgi:hypothetical protein